VKTDLDNFLKGFNVTAGGICAIVLFGAFSLPVVEHILKAVARPPATH